MKPFELTSENYLLFAAKNYNNPSCAGLKEFEDDLKRFKYITRLLKRYKKTGIISERLILNHIILLHNVFEQSVVSLLFFKIESEHWSQLKTFLVFLEYLPNNFQITPDVNETKIPLDQQIINKLRKL